MTKAELRVLYTRKRSALETSDIEHLSREILNHFTAFSLDNVAFIHLFYPIPGRKEVACLYIASWLRAHRPAIKLVLSKLNPADHTLEHLLWTADTRLAMNSWGITEPEAGDAVAPEQLDLVLVPLLACDRAGNRVGYGKGFYDRFLEQCRPDALKVGLSFFEPETELIAPLHETDIPLDFCVTPEGIYEFPPQDIHESISL